MIGVSVVRLVVTVNIITPIQDITWNQAPVLMWTSIEQAAAIITVCVPYLRPVCEWLKNYWKPGLPDKSNNAKLAIPQLQTILSHDSDPQNKDAYYVTETEDELSLQGEDNQAGAGPGFDGTSILELKMWEQSVWDCSPSITS